MKKGVSIVFCLLLISVLSAAVIADEKVDKAYSCLEGKVKSKCSSLSLEEQAFSLLALSYNADIQKECRAALIANSNSQECWPKSSCNLKSTALVILALQYIGEDTSKAEAWLLKQNKTPDELAWYLEIDSKEETRCKISYDNRNYTVTMSADKKLSGGAGTCLNLANSNYWLQISSGCLSKVFTVSCDKDFVSALLYKKSNSDIWHVSSATQAASANGITENKVSAYCFKQDNSCNYEGSLWALLALSKKSEISAFLPYVIALAPDNEKFYPSSFLYIFAGSDEYLADIRNTQSTSGFWDISASPYTRFYNTALSLLALQQSSAEEADKGKTWLLDNQESAGCWGNIRDTSFILYSGWPKTPVKVDTAPSVEDCEEADHYCTSNTECADVEGDVLQNFFCPGMKVCCSKQIAQENCSGKDGIICTSSQTCSGNLVSSSDSSRCCVSGSCEEQETPNCEEVTGNTCKSSCSDTEEIVSALTCSGSDSCCRPKPQTGSAWIWWVIIFIILIALVALAIVFRDRLRLFIFRIKNKFSKGPAVTQTRPPFSPPGAGQARPIPPRPMMRPGMPMPPQARPVQRMQASKSDKELDETLKKLREISK